MMVTLLYLIFVIIIVISILQIGEKMDKLTTAIERLRTSVNVLIAQYQGVSGSTDDLLAGIATQLDVISETIDSALTPGSPAPEPIVEQPVNPEPPVEGPTSGSGESGTIAP